MVSLLCFSSLIAQEGNVLYDRGIAQDNTLSNDVIKMDEIPSPSSGFYVKKGLGIHDKAVLSNAYSSTYLDNSQIVGDGVFLLTSDSKQVIIADNSKIQNLSVHSKDTVTVVGILNITQSLVVESGVFNTSQSTSFNIEEDAVVYIGECASLFLGEFLKDHYEQSPISSGIYLQINSHFSVTLNRGWSKSEIVFYKNTRDLNFIYKDNFRASKYNYVIEPPPQFTKIYHSITLA